MNTAFFWKKHYCRRVLIVEMLKHPFHNIMYRCTFLILLCIDYFIGNGLVDILHKSICKLICFTRKSIREEEKLRSSHIEVEDTVSLSVLVTEIVLLSLMIKVSIFNILTINVTQLFNLNFGRWIESKLLAKNWASYIKSSSTGFTPEQLLHLIAGTGSNMQGVL